MCCQVEVSASGLSPAQRSPTECVVCLSVIVKLRQRGGPGPRGAFLRHGRKQARSQCVTKVKCAVFLLVTVDCFITDC
jgi:hypothetical protein